MSVRRITRALLRSESIATPRATLWMFGAGVLECIARVLGHYDFVRKRPHRVWATATTTKRELADGTPAHREQHILVFQVVLSGREQLGSAGRVARSTLHQLARRIEEALGPASIVSEQKNGTIIASLSGERNEAETAARLLVHDLSGDTTDRLPGNHRHHGGDGRSTNGSLKVACGVITFPPSGAPLVGSIPAIAAG